MPLWPLGVIIRAFNRLCLFIFGLVFVLTLGRVIGSWPYVVIFAFGWVGLLAEWIVVEMRQAIEEALKKQTASSENKTSDV